VLLLGASPGLSTQKSSKELSIPVNEASLNENVTREDSGSPSMADYYFQKPIIVRTALIASVAVRSIACQPTPSAAATVSTASLIQHANGTAPKWAVSASRTVAQTVVLPHLNPLQPPRV
jgi:hypothetical protein